MSYQRKAPYRPRQRTEITQNYNDGIVKIYAEADAAEQGYMPVQELVPLETLCYAERKLGIKRYYDAKMNQINVERVIRVPKGKERIDSQDIAETEDGTKYRIDLVQEIPDVYPPSLDLTLVLYSQGVIVPTPIPTEGGGGDAEPTDHPGVG